MAFADRSKLVIQPTDDFERVEQEIDNMDVGDVGICTGAEPFTDAYTALKASGVDETKDKVRYLVVLTDGVWDNTEYAIKQAKRCHKEGIEVMALGFGDADYDFLRQIASTDDFASLTKLSDLTGSFSKIAQAIGDSASGKGIRMI